MLRIYLLVTSRGDVVDYTGGSMWLSRPTFIGGNTMEQLKQRLARLEKDITNFHKDGKPCDYYEMCLEATQLMEYIGELEYNIECQHAAEETNDSLWAEWNS